MMMIKNNYHGRRQPIGRLSANSSLGRILKRENNTFRLRRQFRPVPTPAFGPAKSAAPRDFVPLLQAGQQRKQVPFSTVVGSYAAKSARAAHYVGLWFGYNNLRQFCLLLWLLAELAARARASSWKSARRSLEPSDSTLPAPLVLVVYFVTSMLLSLVIACHRARSNICHQLGEGQSFV